MGNDSKKSNSPVDSNWRKIVIRQILPGTVRDRGGVRSSWQKQDAGTAQTGVCGSHPCATKPRKDGAGAFIVLVRSPSG